jgi:hypothetical protein
MKTSTLPQVIGAMKNTHAIFKIILVLIVISDTNNHGDNLNINKNKHKSSMSKDEAEVVLIIQVLKILIGDDDDFLNFPINIASSGNTFFYYSNEQEK